MSYSCGLIVRNSYVLGMLRTLINLYELQIDKAQLGSRQEKRKYQFWNPVHPYNMVVRTPGKPGIYLEFENSTKKTWNSHEKS